MLTTEPTALTEHLKWEARESVHAFKQTNAMLTVAAPVCPAVMNVARRKALLFNPLDKTSDQMMRKTSIKIK